MARLIRFFMNYLCTQGVRVLQISCLLLLHITQLPASLTAQAFSPESNPLYVDPASYDFSENIPLLERVASSPHGYFRFINLQFSKEVCRRFEHYFQGMPALNLHGDAHLEQYAITDLGRGLTDFDDSSMGPAFIDLLRFGVSLRLACQESGWDDQSDQLFSTFLLGYREALNNSDAMIDEPEIARNIRAGYSSDRSKYLQWAESQMSPMTADARDSLAKAMQTYVDAMVEDNDHLKRNYFDFVKAGYLKMGIGSALDTKYLVRVRGKSKNPDDDVMLEIKEVRDISGIPCILRTQKSDPFRVLLGQARIAYAPFEHLGYFYYQNKTFWVHSWVENYKEVKIGKTLSNVEQLSEVAFDVGIQLGHGHTRNIASPFDAQLRRSQLVLLAKTEKELRQAVIDLTDLTIEAWQAFRAKLGKGH